MSCKLLQKLDDTQLLTYLDGDADPDLVKHVQGCPHCSARADRLRLDEMLLKAALYRSSCPSPMDLGEYRLGTLARKDVRTVERHVVDCPHCSLELARLERFLGDLAPAPEPDPLAEATGRIRVLVARLVSGARDALTAPTPALAPAYAGIRGAAAGPAIYEAEDAQVSLTAQPSAAAAGRFELHGLLIAPEAAGGSTVNLWRGEDLIASAHVDEGDNFIVSDLTPGVYELVIRGSKHPIYIETLPI
jgi:hypothetical protein